MKGNKNTILNLVSKSSVIQIVNFDKNITVTYKKQPHHINGCVAYVVFVANFASKNDVPISTYFDVDDIQAVISESELLRYCTEAVDQKNWKFSFYNY